MPQYMEYYHLRRFLYSFVDKAIAVDPLDRALWGEVEIIEGKQAESDQIADSEELQEVKY